MSNQFLLIIKKQGEDNFRFFKNGEFNKAANEILKKNDSKYVWGIHKGIIDNSIWGKIRKNDKIYLTVEKENFRISGILSKKIKNLKFGESIYPIAVDKKQINYFLFFEKLDVCNISYSRPVAQLIQFDHNLNIYSQQDPKLRNNHSQNMFNHIKLAKKPKQFLSITGLTVTQFDSLSKEIQKHYKITEAKRLSKNRERKIGAGHKFDHPLKDRIIMLLMYYRMYTTYDLSGMIFDLDKSNVMRDIKYLEHAVKKSIPIPTKKYADSKKLKSLDDIQQFFPELIAITDGTEQPIPRPKNRIKRKTHYSGKEKTHHTKPNYD